MFLSYVYRKQLALKKKRIAASKLVYEDSLLKLKRLQEEKAQLVAEKARRRKMGREQKGQKARGAEKARRLDSV